MASRAATQKSGRTNAGKEHQRRGWKELFREYGLTLTLAALFLACWLAQFIFQWLEFVEEEQQHGSSATLGAFIAPFLSATFENWQSEFLQLFTFVVLTAVLYHRGSHESKDTDEETAATMLRIEKRLEQMGARIEEIGSAAERDEFKELQQQVARARKHHSH